MAMVVEEAGGKASTGKERILDIVPDKVGENFLTERGTCCPPVFELFVDMVVPFGLCLQIHQRLPIFVGSKEDIDELESYGDVQQVGEKKYTI